MEGQFAVSRTSLTLQRYARSLVVVRELSALRPFSACQPNIETKKNNNIETAFTAVTLELQKHIVDDCNEVLAELSGVSTPTLVRLVLNYAGIIASVLDVLHENADILPKPVVDVIHGQFGKVVDKINEMCESAKRSAEDSQSHMAFASIHNQVLILDGLRAIPHVKGVSQVLYNDIIKAVRAAIVRAKGDAEKNIAAGIISSDGLKHSLSVLQQASCFRDHPEGIYSSELDEVIAYAADLMCGHAKELDKTVDFKQYGDMKRLYEMFASMR